MTAAIPTRRIAALAAYAGGAATAAGALGVGVLFGQALIAKLTIPGAEAPPPRCGGDYGAEYDGCPAAATGRARRLDRGRLRRT